MTSDCARLDNTTIQMMLTRTTLCFGQFVVMNLLGSFGTYKPASVKIAVRTICCLKVVRRRHRSGIGYVVY